MPQLSLFTIVIANLVFFAIMFFVVLRLRQDYRQQNLLLRKQLQEQITAMEMGAIGIGQRLMSLEKQQDEPSETVVAPRRWTYQQAKSLVQQGGGASDFVNKCHLNPAEAEVIIKLEKFRKQGRNVKGQKK